MPRLWCGKKIIGQKNIYDLGIGCHTTTHYWHLGLSYLTMTWQQGIDEKNLIHIFEIKSRPLDCLLDYDKSKYNHGRCNQK